MKLKEQMINCQAEYREGLEKGVDICLDMINKALQTEFKSFGTALAHIETYYLYNELKSKGN